jgi:serine/threonine protein kinase
LDVGLALAITRGIAEGLGAAHAQGMVHRDIKPENILMAWNGVGWTPKIADFGIVATKENSSLYTRTGGTMLTMAYAAPEQWRGVRAADLDGRTDLYALGGVLYEMLTGRTVFNAESYEGWAEEHRNIVPKPPSSLRPELANWQGLDGLVLRLLAKDREQRPGDAAEVVGLLDAIRFVAPGAARVTEVERVKPLQRVPTEVERVTELKPAQTSKRPGGTSRRVALWSWVTASVVVLAVGFSIVRGYRNEQPGNVAHSTESQSQPDPPRPETQADPQQARTKPAHAPTSQAPRNVEAGTVWTDPATGLMWPKKDNGSDVDWQQAQSYCRNLRLAGHSDWRLARLDELKGIFDPNISTPGHCCKSHEPVTWHVKGNLQLTAGTWSSLGTARGGAFVYSLVLDQQAEYWQTDFKDLRALCVRRSGE